MKGGMVRIEDSGGVKKTFWLKETFCNNCLVLVLFGLMTFPKCTTMMVGYDVVLLKLKNEVK